MQRRRSGAVCLAVWCRRFDGVSWAFGKVVKAGCFGDVAEVARW